MSAKILRRLVHTFVHLYLYFHGCSSQTKSPSTFTLRVVCDLSCNMYVNGLNIGYVYSPHHLGLGMLSARPRLLAIELTRTSPRLNGMLGSLEGTDIVTDASWKCSRVNVSGWTRLEFDDSAWLPAKIIQANSAKSTQTAESWAYRTVIPTTANWITAAGAGPATGPVFCRKSLSIEIGTNGKDDDLEDGKYNYDTHGYLTASDTFSFYLNGKLNGPFNDLLVKYYLPPRNTSTLAVSCISKPLRPPCVLYGSDNSGMATDTTWKCTSNTPAKGWELPGFNDSAWPKATVMSKALAQYPTMQHFPTDSIRSNASWISAGDGVISSKQQQITIYCRKAVLPKPHLKEIATIENSTKDNDRWMSILCYNAIQLYLDGSQMMIVDSEGHQLNAFQVNNALLSFPAKLSYASLLAVTCQTTSTSQGGLIASTTPNFDSQGQGQIVTDSSWRCSRIPTPGWHTPEFDDTKWPRATEIQRNIPHNISATTSSLPQQLPYVPRISTNATWITVGSANIPGTIYCRKQLKPKDNESLPVVEIAEELKAVNRFEVLDMADLLKMADQKSNALQLVAIIGVSVGLVAVVAVIILAIFVSRKLRMRPQAPTVINIQSSDASDCDAVGNISLEIDTQSQPTAQVFYTNSDKVTVTVSSDNVQNGACGTSESDFRYKHMSEN